MNEAIDVRARKTTTGVQGCQLVRPLRRSDRSALPNLAGLLIIEAIRFSFLLK